MARSRQAQELAILKLYAVLSQAHFVKQQAEEWEGAFLGILALGFPLLLKHTAEIVIHSDKGYSNMVSSCCILVGWLDGAPGKQSNLSLPWPIQPACHCVTDSLRALCLQTSASWLI